MGKMSRDKGKVGEREVAALLRSHGFEARRGVQFQGGHDSQDVHHDIPGLHIEVKRVESLNMKSAMAQAKADAGSGRMPAVFHRKSREDWLVTIGAEDFLHIVAEKTKMTNFAVKIAERQVDPPVFVEAPNDSNYAKLEEKFRKTLANLHECQEELGDCCE